MAEKRPLARPIVKAVPKFIEVPAIDPYIIAPVIVPTKDSLKPILSFRRIEKA